MPVWDADQDARRDRLVAQGQLAQNEALHVRGSMDCLVPSPVDAAASTAADEADYGEFRLARDYEAASVAAGVIRGRRSRFP